MDRSARRASRWRAAVVICVLGPAGLPGLPAHAQSDAVVWEGDDQSVVLVPQDDEEAPPNDHPVAVAAPDIERMLASLRFRYTDHQENDTAPVPVFNAEQIEILGEALAAGLGRATPSQDVRFSIIGAHRLSPGALVRRNRLTAGRVFFREGKLNVIFGELQSPYRKKNIYGRLEQDFYPREYGSRTTPAEREAILVAGTATRLREDTSGARHDWVVFDTGRAPAPADPAADPSTAGARGDVEQRLRSLKRLREQGLVSEEAYRKKVDEILDDL